MSANLLSGIDNFVFNNNVQAFQGELADFKFWLFNQLENMGFDATNWLQALSRLPGDAGSREYFVFKPSACLKQSSNFIAVFSPPDTEQNCEFLQIAEHLRRYGVTVPQVFARNLTRGYFLLEHLGPQLLLDMLNKCTADELYTRAFHQLLKIQLSPCERAGFVRYDQGSLRSELQIFDQWFVAQLLQINLSAADKKMLERTYTVLECRALAQPQVLVHRDFHSRNIIYREKGDLGIIDFQGAKVGAITYDLASLLRDCYIEWPDDEVERLALKYAGLAQNNGLLSKFDQETFLTDFDLIGLQRHIKVLGIFARLSLRDKKHRYMNDLPLVIKYTRKIATKYADLADFAQWFEAVLMPRIEEQGWMQAGGGPS